MSGGFDISIIGCGPAGGCLAALLRLRGFNVLVFDDDKRPDLLVGESLLPPVVPLMRKLEIEDRVRQFSQHKPGVGFIHRGGLRLDLVVSQDSGDAWGVEEEPVALRWTLPISD